MIYTIAIFLYYQCFTLPIFSVWFLCKQMCIFMLGLLNFPFVFILIFWTTVLFKDSCYIVHNNISFTDIKCMKNNKITLRCFDRNLSDFYYIKICLISFTIKMYIIGKLDLKWSLYIKLANTYFNLSSIIRW